MQTKLFFLALTFLSSFSFLNAQTVNGKPISEIDVDYIELTGATRFLSNKVNIEIDFGQTDKLFSSKDTEIRDENNKRVKFNSMIEAVNFFSKNGYAYIDGSSFSVDGTTYYLYIMEKRKL